MTCAVFPFHESITGVGTLCGVEAAYTASQFHDCSTCYSVTVVRCVVLGVCTLQGLARLSTWFCLSEMIKSSSSQIFSPPHPSETSLCLALYLDDFHQFPLCLGLLGVIVFKIDQKFNL